MKVICEGIDLAVAASTVSRAISNKVLNPVLEGIKIVATKNTLILSATDLEVFIEKAIKADVKIEGEAVIPARLFSDYLRKVNNEQVLISQEGNKLKLKLGDSECDFSCLNVAEYPEIVKIKSEKNLQIESKKLKDIISKTSTCVLTDDSRPVLKGVLMLKEDKQLTAVSLDGFRLCKVETKIDGGTDGDFSAIIPSRAMDEIKKLIDDNDKEKINIEFNNNYVQVNTSGVNFVSKLIIGEFWNHRQIIPSEFASNVVVNKKNLEIALERAGLLARIDRNNQVNFLIKENLIVLKSNNEVGNIEEKITAELKGKDLEISFNVKYFNDALKNINDEFIKINFNSSIAPCTITAVTEGNYLFLILPVRIV